ncbi:glycosyltransferase [Nocardia sp. alder85J]|uniref:glycosyltransferase n=1 Tax=Nocardia sp. alder85J TaxID=2862949 RepID=UPI001CD200A9|nr:glycosyltransferase [Nocardia sp. alder85J]MCX4093222.1 glycosyltransferase [Nocardia sp. alder85J]
MTAPRIALVHERFTEYGGSEAVVAEFMKTWPGSPVFAPLATPDCVGLVRAAATPDDGSTAADHRFHTSVLNRAHDLIGRRSHAPLLPLVPAALRRLPLADRFDTVVVSHHAFATQAVFATEAPVVAYVHSPARWAWDPAFRAREAGGRAGRAALTALGGLARRGELRAAPRLARVVANSQAVADRVRDWWGLPATVVHPPVRIDRFAPDTAATREDFFLVAGRLVPYKRADLAIRAARQAGCRLIVLGEGRFRAQLEAIAGPETTFLGAAPDEVLLDTYRRCRALLMPGVEDFGIVPVEAMACGTPVLAVGAGGAVDTVLPGISGEHVEFGDDDAVVAEFARAMRDFDDDAYDAKTIRAHAESYSPSSFRRRMSEVVAKTMNS